MPKYICGATSDIGVGREQQEDFVQFCELDEETLLCIVADGTGSMPQRPQPASIVAMDIIENIKDSFGKKPDLLIKYPKFFLEKAMNDANRILGAFQMGNEELFSGYSASVTCCLFLPDRKIAIGHSGNTRLYIIRNGKVNLITHDHTQAYELLQEGKIDTRKVNAITDAASDSWNRLKNSVTAKSEDEIKDALQSNVEANKKDKWGFRGKKSITGFIN